MRIKIQKVPMAIWHMDCGTHRTGIMKVRQHFAEYSVAMCLGCGEEAKIPIGADFGICFEAEEIKKCQICFPSHCTDTTHGECWCSPTYRDGLVIHQQES